MELSDVCCHLRWNRPQLREGLGFGEDKNLYYHSELAVKEFPRRSANREIRLRIRRSSKRRGGGARRRCAKPTPVIPKARCSMASQSCVLEIPGGASTPSFFGRRDLLQRQRAKFPPARVSAPGVRNHCAAATPVTTYSSRNLPASINPLPALTQRGTAERERITPEMLDELMRDSVKEIVKNVRKAPFLMHLFLDEEDGAKGRSKPKWCLLSSPPRLMLESQEATADSWPMIKRRWEEESCVPDGLILVEELEIEEEEEEEGGATAASRRRNRDEECQRWGVVIEGRGMECSACYILDTCRVSSSMGYCTHFCLVRANTFGGPIGLQVLNAWLQRER